MRNKTYNMYLAKMNITRDLFNHNKIDELINRIVDVLSSEFEPIEIINRGSVWWWAFELIEHFEFEDNRFLICYLNKFKDDQFIKYDRTTFGTTSYTINDHVVDRSIFIFNPETELILFEHRPKISINQFCYLFSKLVEKRTGILEVVTHVLKNEENFINRIKGLSRITAAKFSLVPSNPDNNPLFERLDKSLRIVQATHSELKIKGDSLKYDNTLLEEGVLSVVNGNGKAVIKGEKDGHIEAIDSESFLIHEQFHSSDTFVKEHLRDILLKKIRLKKRSDRNDK
ncbi:hypothetical protein LSG31_00770 [Fodinisporobacter ferrooxydans]|uniref:Uncharacterized protein n=1 Tax=Fodinisporobacter ferrooxydans TaxID=2901836 RepID=A0ABY4CK10_9BACL|nr:hypothetical protein LSG31_00770 [Alicyclobacillaceae bacterium MYW30-H2]